MARTSPSGKSLFVCVLCGRETPAPTDRCPTRGNRGREALCHHEENAVNFRLANDLKYDKQRLMREDVELQGPGVCRNCLGMGCHVCVTAGASPIQLTHEPLAEPVDIEEVDENTPFP